MPTNEYQPLYARYLAMIRPAYPKAKIVPLRPFCGAQESAIKASVDACNAAEDYNVYYIDATGCPNVTGSEALAERLTNALKSKVLSTKTSR